MNSLLYKSLIMLLPLILSQIIYFKIDKRYDITNTISSKIPIQQQWRAAFCFCCVVISIFVIGVFGIYVIEIPDTIYNILNGILAGIGIGMTSKMSIKKVN